MFMTSRRRSGWGTFAMLLAGLGLVVVMPFRLIDRVPTPVVAAPPAQATPVRPCLTRLAPFFHADLPVDREKAGPGNEVKRNKDDFGASAVPVNFDSLTAAEALADVQKTYIEAICGSLEKQRGPNTKLYQVGQLAIDASYNPNTQVTGDWDALAAEVDNYLASIFWERSRIEVTTMPEGMWTLSMGPRGPPANEPSVYALQHNQPKSHYLVLVVQRPDGTLIEDWRRLECFFQPRYLKKGDVPVALRV